MNRRTIVGFDRRLDLEWLDATAGQVAAGADAAAIRTYLDHLLSSILAGGADRGARDKTITLLVRIWRLVPDEVKPLRDRALALLPGLTQDGRLAAHWAMVVATYPFFADVAGIAGRLLALQGDVTSAQIIQRVTETWGARSTTDRAARRVIRSMVQWGVLADAAEKGTYHVAGLPRRLTEEVAELLVEALLLDAGGAALTVPHLANHPALFPFQLTLNPHYLSRDPRFDVQRQGLDVDLVMLAEPPLRRVVQVGMW